MSSKIKYPLVGEVKAVYKKKISVKDRPIITSSKKSADAFRAVWDADTLELHESFKVMMLSSSNKILGVVSVSDGGVAACVVDVKLIFSIALKCVASAIILCHNHPSGNLQPSQQDIALTNKIVKGGEILDIRVLDHIILTEDSYFSFSDNGKI